MFVLLKVLQVKGKNLFYIQNLFLKMQNKVQ